MKQLLHLKLSSAVFLLPFCPVFLGGGGGGGGGGGADIEWKNKSLEQSATSHTNLTLVLYDIIDQYQLDMFIKW